MYHTVIVYHMIDAVHHCAQQYMPVSRLYIIDNRELTYKSNPCE